jgi:formate C-acetyltransferase
MTTPVTAEAERIEKLREKMLTPPELCIERGYLLTESYKETESEPIVIRRAKALHKILSEITIGIDDGELIAGRGSSKQRAGMLSPELTYEWYLEEMDLLSTRDWDRFSPLPDQDKAKMREFLPYWKGRSLVDMWRAKVPKDILCLDAFVQIGGSYCCNNQYYGHSSVDYERMLKKGLSGIKKEVDEQLRTLVLANAAEVEKYHFLTAVNITLDGATIFANRYAVLAAQLAESEVGVRKSELQRIAEICAWVPMNPARDFREALQSLWFTYLVLMLEAPGPGMGFLRADQYLYPYYQRDLFEGRITREEALELIELFFIKTNGLVIPYPAQVARVFAGLCIGAQTTIGGLTPDGRDAVNDLSYLFLEAEKDVALNAEDLVIRVHKKTPDAFVMKACEVSKALRGKLKFLSDETTMQQLMQDGKPVEYARDYAVTGCHIPTVPGRSLDIPGGMVNLPLMLELALNNGVCRLTGQQIGPRTGDPRNFKTYDKVWSAFRTQVEALLPAALLFRNVDKQVFAENAPCPFHSALYRSCIQKCLDVNQGGTAPYLTFAVGLAGAPNVGDSLAAIKKTVFEDKAITMEMLLQALERNFENEEEVLYKLSAAPKFGNNDEYVDSIVNDVLTLASTTAHKYEGFAGSISNVSGGAVTANIPLGYVVGALPDGRKSGLPLSEGGLSPYQGRNVCGPTATMASVARLDQTKLTNGSVLNMRFTPEALKDETSTRKFASLIRNYCETGGALVQFNIVSTEMLKEAQRHPEKYKDLLVRVATYSAYFVELSPELQNDIIARMEFETV